MISVYKIYVMTENGNIELHHFCVDFVTAVDSLDSLRNRIDTGEFKYLKAWMRTDSIQDQKVA